MSCIAATTLSKFASGSPMPIITTLVIGRSVAAAAAERAVREPQLPDDLGHGQVAVEALAAGRAERALQRAARLRRDAQRAARGLGDEYGFDRVAGADVEQPLAGAVGGGRVAPHRAARRSSRSARAARAAPSRRRSSRRSRPRRPGGSSAAAAARDTASRRAPAQKASQLGGREAEQVDHAWRGQREQISSVGKK